MNQNPPNQDPNQEALTQLQRTLEELKKVAREFAWQRSAVLGQPEERGDWPEVFVLMPFADALHCVYEHHIREAVSSLGLRIDRADNFFGTGSIMKDIWSAIHAAQIVVADCSGRNANVFYEIGLAHAIGKQTILISQSPDDIPFDLKHLRHIHYQYTSPGMEAFEKALIETIRRSM